MPHRVVIAMALSLVPDLVANAGVIIAAAFATDLRAGSASPTLQQLGSTLQHPA